MIEIKRAFRPARGFERIDELPGYLFTPEMDAHTFIITKMEKVDGQETAVPFDAGTEISARLIKADGVTELVDGSLADGAAVVTLPAECYQVPGRFTLTVYASLDGTVTCIYAATSTVLAGDTEDLNIAGGTVRNIDAKIGEIRDAISDAQDAVDDIGEAVAGVPDVIASIPQDYTALSDSVSDLKSIVSGGLLSVRQPADNIADGAWYAANGVLYRDATSNYKAPVNLIDISDAVVGSIITVQTTISGNYGVYIGDKDRMLLSRINGNNAAEHGYVNTTSVVQTVEITVPENAYYLALEIRSTKYTGPDQFTISMVVMGTEKNVKYLKESDVPYNKLSQTVQDVLKSDVVGRAYEYEGAKIVTKHTLDYSLLGTTDGLQAGCVYDGKLFKFNPDGTFLVYDYATIELAGEGTFSGITPHCNSACFGSKYDEDDPFPLVYVNAYNDTGVPNGTCYVCRISVSESTYTATPIQTINVGFTDDPIWVSTENEGKPYGNFTVDVERGILYAYTLRDAEPCTRFFAFNLPDVSNSTVSLAKTDILTYWDCPYFDMIQDTACYGGKIYICTGRGNAERHGYARVIDPVSRAEVSRIDLYAIGIHAEPEMIDVYNGTFLCGGRAVYKFEF